MSDGSYCASVTRSDDGLAGSGMLMASSDSELLIGEGFTG